MNHFKTYQLQDKIINFFNLINSLKELVANNIENQVTMPSKNY